MDVDLSGALRDEIRRETTPCGTMPGVELDEAMYEKELGLVVPATKLEVPL
jgi:hypothetical protein